MHLRNQTLHLCWTCVVIIYISTGCETTGHIHRGKFRGLYRGASTSIKFINPLAKVLLKFKKNPYHVMKLTPMMFSARFAAAHVGTRNEADPNNVLG